jgi:hypothetical protein
MLPSSPHHLTYCTNIHPGENWEAVQRSLRHLLAVKEQGGGGPFGIGLRLSARAANELRKPAVLDSFRRWLTEHDCYVFTINGFPYGGFHGRVVKDRVHAPDWTTSDRLLYTKHLFDILAELLPEGLDGGVSTSPLSYQPWHRSAEALRRTKEISAHYLLQLAEYLDGIYQRTGKLLHLDIEPEPDGVLEDTAGFVRYYNEYLLRGKVGERLVRRHLQLCYDICHFAVQFEEPKAVLDELNRQGLRVGKLQISAALKAHLYEHGRTEVAAALGPYAEPVYLHQTNLLRAGHEMTSYPDLAPALAALNGMKYDELRTHFHVPIYTDSYGVLRSTNDAIEETLKLWRQSPFTHHLEVETYTWDVLPDHQRLGLVESIHRELEWVRGQLQSRHEPTFLTRE